MTVGSYFFTFESGIPAGMGFDWYGSGHLTWLLGITVAAILLGLRYRACGDRGRRIFDRAVAVGMLALESLWLGMLAAGGNLTVYMLPLHLCSISIFLYILYGFCKTSWIGEYIYAFGMPGGLAALLFPDWNPYPLDNYFCISSFLLHGLLVVYGVMLLMGGTVRPSLENLWKPMGFVLLLSAPVCWFDGYFRVNYMFLSEPSPGSPLELFARFGHGGYLAAFFVLVLAIELAIYFPWRLAVTFSRKRTS